MLQRAVLLLLLLLLRCLSCSCYEQMEVTETEGTAVKAEATAERAHFEHVLALLRDQLRQVQMGSFGNASFDPLFLFCRILENYNTVHPRIIPDIYKMQYVLHSSSGCRNVSVALNRPNELWQSSEFDRSKPTVILITGWKTTINESNSGPVAKAYHCRNDTNFVVLDAAGFIDTLYTWSALNTEAIGEVVATSLTSLNLDYVTQRLHLVGHSLGAHIAGSIGRNYKMLTGYALRRITGLDPANPCFYNTHELPGLSSGDAKFVDIIHTNPELLGTSKRVGDADFFVNGLNAFQPGCLTTQPFMFGCSHQRAVDYYTESVYPTNSADFVGNECAAYADLYSGANCKGNSTVMGFAAHPDVLGIFYVNVNRAEPFGQQADASTYTYMNSTCGSCGVAR